MRIFKLCARSLPTSSQECQALTRANKVDPVPYSSAMASTSGTDERAVDLTEAVSTLLRVLQKFQEDAENGRKDFVLVPMDVVRRLLKRYVYKILTSTGFR